MVTSPLFKEGKRVSAAPRPLEKKNKKKLDAQKNAYLRCPKSTAGGTKATERKKINQGGRGNSQGFFLGKKSWEPELTW